MTGATRYRDAAERAYGWFLGGNDLGLAVADPASGACGDGLGPAGASVNRGAESTLMWLTALEHTRAMRAAGTAAAAGATASSPPGALVAVAAS